MLTNEKDVFKNISNFISDQSDWPIVDVDVEKIIATGSFTNDDNPESKLSSCFDDFKNEYPIIASGLENISLENCLETFGGILCLPHFQSNTYRLELLVHLSFMLAKGEELLVPEQIANWFNGLNSGTCQKRECPTKDVFISSVRYDSSNYRLFAGSSEGTSFNMQLLINILHDMPNESLFDPVKKSIASMLIISEEIAKRFNLPIFSVGELTPILTIKKPQQQVIERLRQHIKFSSQDLTELGIERENLTPFTVSAAEIQSIGKYCPDNSPLKAKPIFQTGDNFILFQPSFIGTAIIYYIIQSCRSIKFQDKLHKALAKSYISNFSNNLILGASINEFRMQKNDEYYSAKTANEVDVGRFLQIIIVVNNFLNFEDGNFSEIYNKEKIKTYITRSISEVFNVVSAQERFHEGVTIVILVGWENNVRVVVESLPENWKCETMSGYDAITLNNYHEFDVLDIFRVLHAQALLKLQKMDIVNDSGFLNLYGWMKNNFGHIVPYGDLDDEFLSNSTSCPVCIPHNCNLAIRHSSNVATDVMVLPRPDGTKAYLKKEASTPKFSINKLVPFYVDTDKNPPGTVRSVYVGRHGYYWIEVQTESIQDSDFAHRVQSEALFWSEQVFRYFDDIAHLSERKNIYCIINFNENLISYTDMIFNIDDNIWTHVNYEYQNNEYGFQALISFTREITLTDDHSDDPGGKQILEALIISCVEAKINEQHDSDVNDILNSIIKSDISKHYYAFNHSIFNFMLDDIISAKSLKISPMDDATIELGIGWMCRGRPQGSNIEGLDECKYYLDSLLVVLIEKYKDIISKFNRAALLEILLRNHEMASLEQNTWLRMFGYLDELNAEKDLVTTEANESISHLNKVSIASRIAIEAAICECSIVGGITPGTMDITQLLAYGLRICQIGEWYEAIDSGIAIPNIKIFPAGQIIMDHKLLSDVIRPFGELYRTQFLSNESSKYSKNHHIKTDKSYGNNITLKTIEKDKIFEDAWFEEYGFSLENISAILDGFNSLIETERKLVMKLQLADLIDRLHSTCDLEHDIIIKCILPFSYYNRQNWNTSPNEYLPSAWFPCRYKRQLSLRSKPIIILGADNQECLIAPSMIVSCINDFIKDARSGTHDHRIFKRNGKMWKFIGAINFDRGINFSKTVADELKINEWITKTNVSDGEILKIKKDPSFGDVDVLAWHKNSKRVLIIECKDLSPECTNGEVARRLSKYQGNVTTNGKRDYLKKHLDRCEVIEKNIDKLSKYIGFKVSAPERILLFSQITPLQFEKSIAKHSVKVVTFQDIANL